MKFGMKSTLIMLVRNKCFMRNKFHSRTFKCVKEVYFEGVNQTYPEEALKYFCSREFEARRTDKR